MPDLLIVEDNDGLREQMKWAFMDHFTVLEADSADSCYATVRSKNPDIVCLDMGLDNVPDKGLEVLDAILTHNRRAKVIVITANTAESLGPESIHRGAFDFLQKPIDLDRLKVIIDRAARMLKLESPADPVEQAREVQTTPDFHIVGTSEPMLRVFQFIDKLSKTDVNVLITGESGTGKELCARAIHYHSRRKDKPFVPINCGAIPETLIESELFGYVRGAFTGANADKTGLIESAHGGTLFLDEIGDMPRHMQVKLLRFLEDQKVQRVGSTGSTTVDVRIIAATNKKIDAGDDSRMRSDLYFRLSEFEIRLPSLKERGRDTLLIAESILRRNREKFDQPKLALSARAEELLKRYSWPGNVRELENKLSRAAITCVNQTIEAEDLQLSASSMAGMTLKEARDMFEKDFVVNALRRAKYNISDAARVAGISRPTLYDLMKKHDITLETKTQLKE